MWFAGYFDDLNVAHQSVKSVTKCVCVFVRVLVNTDTAPSMLADVCCSYDCEDKSAGVLL